MLEGRVRKATFPDEQIGAALTPPNWIVLNWSFPRYFSRPGGAENDEGIEVFGRGFIFAHPSLPHKAEPDAIA